MEALELEPMLSSPAATVASASASAADKDDDDEPCRTRRNRSKKEACTGSPASISYAALICTNRPFALYLCSYITNHIGEWLTYLASLTALSQMQQQHNANAADKDAPSSATMIGALVAVRLLTNVAASPWGGALADAMDRRQCMILLDLAGALTAGLFILAVYVASPTLIFVATFVQECLTGLYEPSRSAIVPLLCRNDAELEKATLLTGMAWSAVAALGSAAGGILVTWLGLYGCFVVDGATYITSALFMMCVGGDWSVATTTKSKEFNNNENGSLLTTWTTTSPFQMVYDGWMYLQSTSWGPLVFLKFSATWLTMDVLMVDFANRGVSSNIGNGNDDDAPLRLGALFGAVGVGCFVGSPLADAWTTLQRPMTVQWAAVMALGLSTLACFMIACRVLDNPLWLLCLLTVLRSSGVSILWIQSSLLLQKLCLPHYLGRVSSMDYGLALGGEAMSALVTGRLRDAAGWTPEQVCAWLAILGAVFTTAWVAYTWHCQRNLVVAAASSTNNAPSLGDLELSETEYEDDQDDQDDDEMKPISNATETML